MEESEAAGALLSLQQLSAACSTPVNALHFLQADLAAREEPEPEGAYTGLAYRGVADEPLLPPRPEFRPTRQDFGVGVESGVGVAPEVPVTGAHGHQE